MANVNNIELNGRPVPVIAFFGTRGGVGKSTISSYMAELILAAPGYNRNPPNVLLIDMDVNARQLSMQYVEQHVVSACPTIHELVRLNEASQISSTNVTSLVDKPKEGGKDRPHGELFFVPSAKREHTDVYSVGANADPDELCKLLSDLIQNIVIQDNISCVILDCTAIIDNYTAAAATIADAAFCISLVEPKAFDRVDEQGEKIRHICKNFDPGKLKAILNKSRRKDRIDLLKKTKDVFYAIPYTDELLRGEGFEKPDELRVAIFKDHIVQLCDKILRHRWPELVPPPSVTVPAEIAVLSQVADKLEHSPGMKRLKMLRRLKAIGAFILAVSIACLIVVSKMDLPNPAPIAETETELYADSPNKAPLADTKNELTGESRDASSSSGGRFGRTVLSNISILGLFIGFGLMMWGVWASRRYSDMLEAISALRLDVVWVIKQLEENDMRQRLRVKRLFRLARGLPEMTALR
ncbi:MAG: hypothetical protein ACYTEL_01485 [Planctomycetota bacterium]|jgi:cellulose biosynthesis protein BcsQ